MPAHYMVSPMHWRGTGTPPYSEKQKGFLEIERI